MGSAVVLEAMNDQAGWSRALKPEVSEGTDQALWLHSTQRERERNNQIMQAPRLNGAVAELLGELDRLFTFGDHGTLPALQRPLFVMVKQAY